MKYKTPAALEMAVKSAARASLVDTNKAISGFYFDRLLCRVFSESEPSFILKGGQSMLARTLSARATRDIDLLSDSKTADEALNELRRLAKIDLDDFLTFNFMRAEKIKAEEEYREGYKAHFAVYFGSSAKGEVSVDLVADQIVYENPEKITPKSRLDIEGLATFDYLLYPTVYAIADKICATMQLYEGHESSRMKDLIDLVVYLTTQSFEGEALRRRVEFEASFRKMNPIKSFEVPQSWLTTRRSHYAKLASETGLAKEYHDINASFSFVSQCINAVLSEKVGNKKWSYQNYLWE